MGLGAYCQYITFTALLHPYVKDVTCRGKTLYTPGKDSLHTGVKAVTYRGKGSYILG